MTTVVNIQHGREYDQYIGRDGHGFDGYFGNPFKDMSREDAIAKFRAYFYDRIARDPTFKKRVEALRGKRLGCFCKPLRCHGDVYVEYLEGVKRT